MTLDIYAWKAPRVSAPAVADLLVQLYHDGEVSTFEPSPDVEAFFNSLTSRSGDAPSGAETGWASPPARSDKLIEMHLSWSAPDELFGTITLLAWEHDLVLYVPDGPYVRVAEPPAPAPFQVRPAVRAIAAIALGVIIAIAAYALSIPVLSGLVIVLGGFLVVIAVLGLAVQTNDWWRARSLRRAWTNERPDPAAIRKPVPTPVVPEAPRPAPRPQADPGPPAIPTARVLRIRDGLRRAGWTVRDGGPAFGWPHVLRDRYPTLPAAYVEFVDGLLDLANPDESAWFLTRADFDGIREGSAFAWDEWERTMLRWDPTARAETVGFWDRHMPILLTVGGDYGYLALAIEGSGPARSYWPVRRAFAPDWDQPTDVSPSFEAFMVSLDRRLLADEPREAIEDWLLI